MFLLFLAFSLSLIITFLFTPFAVEKLRINEHTVADKYKFDQPKIPTHGAIVVVFTVFLVVAFLPLLSRIGERFLSLDYVLLIDEMDLAILLVIAIYGFFGVVDDLIDLGALSKLIFPICFSFPLIVVFSPTFIKIPFYGEFNLEQVVIDDIEYFDYSDFMEIIIIPVYVMVISNLVNMHSGFNGLQSGLSCIILSTVILKSIIDGDNTNNITIAMVFLGGMLSLWYYNKYPAKLVEGNVGALVFGSTIGTLLVIKGLYFFGVFIFLPHIIDFCLWFYKSKIKGVPFNEIKFGVLREDGTISPPTAMKLKFLFPYYFRMTEKEAVYSMYILTLFFCVSGLLIF